MNVLLTNDDGIQSDGIQILAEKISATGKHNVYVVAPDSNRSAVSHHLTMFGKSKLTEYKKNQWACSGYPADCAFIGFASDLCNEKIDVVVSGINAGGNLGTDIIYSGTCGAARQAVLDGVPGIAVSAEPLDWEQVQKEGFKFNALADFVANNLEKLTELASVKYPRVFVNVNGASANEYKGVKLADNTCVRRYGDNSKIIEENGEMYAQYLMGCNKEKNYDLDSDAVYVANGYISVSRIYADPMCAKTSGMVDEEEFKL